jgi:hypothetical protein
MRQLVADNALLYHQSQNVQKLDQHKQLEAIQQRLQRICSVPNDGLTLDVDLLQQLRAVKTIDKDHHRRRKSILKDLSFPQLPVRKSMIPEAHAKTFRWIFE